MLGDLDFNPGSGASWLNHLTSVSLSSKIKGLDNRSFPKVFQSVKFCAASVISNIYCFLDKVSCYCCFNFY